MALTMTVAGVDRTANLRINTVNITSDLNGRDTCSLVLKSDDGSYRPGIGNSVAFTDGADTHFGGTINAIDESKYDEGSAGINYEVSCVDYNQLADRHLVARSYSSQTLGAIATDIVTNDLAGEGVTTTGVQTGPTITKALFNYIPVSQCFNELSEITGYTWNINYSKDLKFFARETNAAPFSLSDTSYNFRKMHVRRTRDQYRNKQYVRAGTDLTTSRAESFKGDGTRKAFTLAFPVGLAPTEVTVDTVAKTVGIRGIDSGKDWYYAKGDPVITQDDGASALSSANTLAITYQGLFPIIVSSQNDGEITTRAAAETGTGVYEAVEDDPNLDDDDAALERAQGLLRRYGEIAETVEFETDTSGLQAGQLISITVTAHGLSGLYLIDHVKAEDIDGQRLRWQVRALSGETVGGWVDFFQRLAEQGRKFVIRDNEVLLLLRSQTDNVICGESLAAVDAAPESRVGTALVGFSEVGV